MGGTEGGSGTRAPEDLGAGPTFTPEPEPALGLVLNATLVFNEATTIYNDSQCAGMCDKHPTSVISFNPCNTL